MASRSDLRVPKYLGTLSPRRLFIVNGSSTPLFQSKKFPRTTRTHPHRQVGSIYVPPPAGLPIVTANIKVLPFFRLGPRYPSPFANIGAKKENFRFLKENQMSRSDFSGESWESERAQRNARFRGRWYEIASFWFVFIFVQNFWRLNAKQYSEFVIRFRAIWITAFGGFYYG